MTQWNTKWIGIAMALLIVLAAGGFLAFSTGLVGSVLGAQPTSIGWVDMQRALAAHPDYPAAEAALRDYAQAQLADAQTRMKTMTPAQRQALQAQVRQTIINKRTELYGTLDKDVRAAVQKVAAHQHMGVVLEWNAVLYGGVDLTRSVIKALTNP